MLQPLLMVCVLAVFLREAVGRPWLAPWVPLPAGAAITLSLMVCIALLTHLRLWRAARRLSRTGDWRMVRRADRTVSIAWMAAAGVHIFGILGLGWLDAVRATVGDLPAVDELIALLPLLAVIAAAWWSLYPVDRRLREATLIRDLDEGRPVYPQVTRGGFVIMAVRHQMAIILLPILLVMGWSELVVWGAQHWVSAQSTPAAPWASRIEPGPGERAAPFVLVAQGAGTLTIFALMPLVMRRVWDTQPLGEGPLRDRLDALCRRHRVRNRDLLVWRTQGTMINGAVMGLLAPFRYIMLTDSLLDHLDDRQVEAVMAHEVAHVRQRHMAWLAVAMIASLVGVTFLAQYVPPWADIPATLLSLGIALIVFGFVSRRFEWQADAFAAKHLSAAGSFPDISVAPPTPVVTADAVAAMSGALQAVADLNHVPPERFSWRHGSIATRQRKLADLVGLPVDALPVDREARVVKAVSLLVILAAIAAAAYASLSPAPADTPLRADTIGA